MTSVIDGDEEMSEVRRTTQMIVWSLFCHPSCGSIFLGNYVHHPRKYPLINSTAFFLAAYLVTYMLAVIAERGARYESNFAISLGR